VKETGTRRTFVKKSTKNARRKSARAIAEEERN
jgi:hypothetical protein